MAGVIKKEDERNDKLDIVGTKDELAKQRIEDEKVIVN